MLDIEKVMGRYGATLVLSYNPNAYGKLASLPLREVIRFFLLTLLWGAVIFTVTFLFMSINYVGNLPEKLDVVEEFSFEGSLVTDREVVLFNEPSISIAPPDAEPESLIMVTSDGIWYPSYLFFGRTFTEWDDVRNLKEESNERDNILKGLMFFILPSVLFWFFLIGLIKIGLLFVVLLLVGYYLPKFAKQKISFNQNMKACMLAMPSAILIGVGFSPLGFELFWWGAILTAIVYGISVALLSERRLAKSRRAKHK